MARDSGPHNVYPRKPRIMSAGRKTLLVGEGVIGRSPGLRSAINHSKGPCVASLNNPRPQVRIPPPDPYLCLSANPISGTESCNHHFPLSRILSINPRSVSRAINCRYGVGEGYVSQSAARRLANCSRQRGGKSSGPH